jgi:hypothetical protein
MTPRDNYAFVGEPPMFRPETDEVHVSCTFTWDLPEARRLVEAWRQYYPVVRIGGPAVEPCCASFIPGKYIRPGITFTSRGCNNNCPWCFVPEREGKIKLISEFQAGTSIQDNNFAQTGRWHIGRVFEMLRYQGKAVTFSGGIDARLVDDYFVDELRTITIDEIFLAADTKAAIPTLAKAIKRIGLPRQKVRAYALLKFNPDETFEQAEERMRLIWEAGAMPSAQLFQPKDKFIEYPREWKNFERNWQRPAIMKTVLG